MFFCLFPEQPVPHIHINPIQIKFEGAFLTVFSEVYESLLIKRSIVLLTRAQEKQQFDPPSLFV